MDVGVVLCGPALMIGDGHYQYLQRKQPRLPSFLSLSLCAHVPYYNNPAIIMSAMITEENQTNLLVEGRIEEN
jgi:hypothetical protein